MPETTRLKRPFYAFVMLSTLIFLVLFSLVGLSIVLALPSFISLALQAISAWSSTIAFIMLYKRLYPDVRFWTFVRSQFAPKLKPVVVFLAILIPTGIFMFTAFAFALGDSTRWFAISYAGFGAIVGSFLFNLINGPLGEQLGWRGFALNTLQKKHSPLTAGVIIGLFWGLWHFPLWFVTGYTGMDLIQYIFLFMITIVSFSVVMTWLYNLNKNLMIPIILHLLFNFLTSLIAADLLLVFYYVSSAYVLVALTVTLCQFKMMVTPGSFNLTFTEDTP